MAGAEVLSGRRRADLPYGAVLVAVIAWASGPLFVRAISAPALTIAVVRMALAIPVTGAVAHLSGARLSARTLRSSALPGALFVSAIVTSFASFQSTSIANATLIPALQPVLVLLVAGRLFGERVGRRQLVLGAISLCGVALVVFGASSSSSASLRGDLLAVANLACFTGYFLEVKRQRNRGVGAAPLLAGVVLTGAMLLVPYALVVGMDFGALGPTDWPWLVAMVTIPGTIGHGLMNWAQRFVDVTISSLIALANPVLAAIGAFLFFGQQLTVLQVIGGAVVLLATAAVIARRRPTVADVVG